MLLRQYNVADNVYQQKYPDLEPEIVEDMSPNDAREEEEVREEDLDDAYDIVYISDREEDDSIKLHASTVRTYDSKIVL